jgi:hypothetical protein
VLKAIHALKSVSDPGNIFDLKPKWERTLPLEIVHGIFAEILPSSPPFFLFFFISKLIFDTLLWDRGAETHPGT